jgi:O-antigen/teichoic acid export membrane protein
MPLLRRLYIHSLRAGFWASLLAALVLYFLGGWIVVTWTQGRVTMNPLLFYWLLLSSVAAVLWYSGLILLRADNKHLHVAVWYVISSLLAVVVAALLLRTTANLANAGLALLVMDALMTVYVLYTISMITGLSVFKLMVRMLDLRPYMMQLYGIINHI